MKKKEDKRKEIDSLRQDLARLQNLFVTGYEKLRVGQDFELRKVVRNVGGKYRVVKNNLAERASEGTPAEQVLKGLRGMTSVAYASNDTVAGARRCITPSDIRRTRQPVRRHTCRRDGTSSRCARARARRRDRARCRSG